MPEAVMAGPQQGPEGVRHEILSCSLIDGLQVRYAVAVSNPYPYPVDAYIGASLDGEEAGIVWGWFNAPLPQGDSTLIIDTEMVPEWDVSRWNAIERDVGAIETCSVHLVGFDQPEVVVQFPVAGARLSG